MIRIRVLFRGLAIAFANLRTGLRAALKKPATLVLPTDDIPADMRGVYFHVEGKAGQTVSVSEVPGAFFFKGERLVATDTSSKPGYKTKIAQIYVGNKMQTPANSAALTYVFHKDAVGNDIEFDVCQPLLLIGFRIHFLEDCSWCGTLWGRIVK